MAGRKHDARIIQLDAHLIAAPWHQWRWRLMSVAVRKVQYSVADPQRRLIGTHVAETDDQVGDRFVGGDIKRNDRCSEDLDGVARGAVSNTSDRASSSR